MSANTRFLVSDAHGVPLATFETGLQAKQSLELSSFKLAPFEWRAGSGKTDHFYVTRDGELVLEATLRPIELPLVPHYDGVTHL